MAGSDDQCCREIALAAYGGLEAGELGDEGFV